MKEYHPGLEGYHPGLEGVIATESSISDINGEKGILSYRGYSIEDLAKKTSFEETKTGKEVIIVHEIPYQVNKSKLIEKIADTVKNNIVCLLYTSDAADE